MDAESSEKEFSNFLFLEKVEKNLECLSLLDLAMRPIIYAKFSSYFSTSFDEVINCTSCRESRKPQRAIRGSKSKIRHARMSERMSESEAHAQTPLTDMTIEVTEIPQFAEVMVHATESQQTTR
ncbi:hypothetical protein FSP39_023102 [Pinctada imbricata]|uniref:Uncharacterized protein n=1 Tax=Pinctada imbricata TaxID=66713 RepID=A0AA89C2N2_PINIB|nr:hypothetical protein FSP39_023102 [Pinctada imbricata]